VPLFHIVDDAFVILRCRGVFRQARVYLREGFLYAGWAGDFVRLSKGGTSRPDVLRDEIDVPFKYTFDALEKMKIDGPLIEGKAEAPRIAAPNGTGDGN
jgi:hypothetical protein